MKTKIIFSTENFDKEFWSEMPILPRIGESLRVCNFVSPDILNEIKSKTNCWSGERGLIQSLEYCKNNDEIFVEMFVWCED